MTLSIEDIDRWDSDSINAVSQASSNRTQSAGQASTALGGLSAFDSWKGSASAAAMQKTQTYASSLESHGQDASGVSNATRVAASEVNQIKSELNSLRSSAGSYGIQIDPASSKAIPPPNFDSLPDDTKQLVQTMTKNTQAAINSLRTAADSADGRLADAVRGGKRDDFDLDPQYVVPQGFPHGTPPPESSAACVSAVTAVTALTWEVWTYFHPRGSENCSPPSYTCYPPAPPRPPPPPGSRYCGEVHPL